MSESSNYYIVSILNAAWKLNEELSLAQVVYLAASRVGYNGNEIYDCDNKQLVEGLHGLIQDNL